MEFNSKEMFSECQQETNPLSESKQSASLSLQNVQNDNNESTEVLATDHVAEKDGQGPSSELTNSIASSVCTSEQSCVSASINCSNSKTRQEEMSSSGSNDVLSNTSTGLMIHCSNKDARQTPENGSRNELDEISDASCTPIILSVRGNATDIDDATVISTDPSCSRTCLVNDRNIPQRELNGILPHNDSKKTCTSVSGICNSNKASDDFVSGGTSAIKSPLLNSMPSHTELHLSTSKKYSASASVNTTTPAASLLLSVASSISASTLSVSPSALMTTIAKTSGIPSKNAVMKSAITSISKPEKASPVVKKIGSNESSTPITSTIKIVLKGSDNEVLTKKAQTAVKKTNMLVANSCKKQQNTNNNDSFDADQLCKSIVDAIFKNVSVEESKGMTRDEVFKTKLLDPCKKLQRECHEKQFVCTVCGDEFHFEEFLNQHFARKTFLLSYFCRECNEMKTFYNKCKFWLHLQHKHPESVNDEEILRAESTHFRLKPLSDSLSSESKIGEARSSYCVCKFCKTDFPSKKLRALHIKKTSSFLYTCHKCSLLLANQCALAAHLAIHEASGNNHVCPQCGENIDHSEGLRTLFEHLDSCFHFNTRYVMSCECGEMFSTTSDFKSHFLSEHTQLLYRCRVCGSCFTLFANFIAHCSRSHKSVAFIMPDKIVLCSVCKEGFPDFMKLKNHVEIHANNIGGLRKKVLSCFLCNSYFCDPKSLCNHVEKSHIHRPKRCTKCFGLFESRQKLVEHIVSKSCSPIKLPNKLHLCLDNLSHHKNADVSINTYKEMFNVAESLSKPRMKSKSILPVSNPTASATSVQTTPRILSSQRAIVGSSKKSTSSIASFSNVTRGVSSSPYTSAAQSCVQILSKTESSISPKVTSTNISPVVMTSVTQSSKKEASTGKLIGPDINEKKIQCHSCKICLIGKHMFNKHIALHKLKGVDMESRDNFCSVCMKTIDSGVMQSHLEDHQKQGVVVCSYCQRRNFTSMAEALKHSRNMCNYTTVTKDGAGFIRKKKSSNANENVESGDNVLYEENRIPSDLQSSYTTPIQERGTVFPCLMCGLAFTSKQEKEDHVSRTHDGTRTLYFCLICKRKGEQKCFMKKNLLSRHISRRHRIVNPSQVTKFIHIEEQNVASGQVVPSESSGQRNGDGPPPKRLRLANEGDFMCGKCGFSSEDAILFEDHIVTHNPNKEPQCPECGLCFTVITALKKHLFVVHKIKATEEYLEKKGMLNADEEIQEDDDDDDSYSHALELVDTSSPHSEVETRKVKRTRVTRKASHEFECTVCYRSLISKAALQKHMRNHGMAFIRSKRLDKS